MQDQPYMLGLEPEPIAHARRGDIDTSRQAAEAVTPHIKKLQARVLEFARERSQPWTDIDLLRHFDSTSSTYRTRRAELVALGLLADTGERVALGNGRRHALWTVTDKGMAA